VLFLTATAQEALGVIVDAIEIHQPLERSR
jgi:hypothetical protein